MYFSDLLKDNNSDYRIIDPSIYFTLLSKSKYNKDEIKDLTDDIKKLVNDFYCKISYELDESNKENVFSNLNNLKIIQTMLYFKNSYDSSLNILDLKDNFDYVDFIHKLLVVSSSSYEEDRQGFNHGDDELPINKYYEEFLENKLFDIRTYNGDEYPVSVVEFISNILGYDKMLNYYMSGNYKGLLQDLISYSSYKDTMKFINDMNTIYNFNSDYASGISIKDEVGAKDSIREYLIRIYSNKILSSNIKFEREEFEFYMLKKLDNIPKLNLNNEENIYKRKSNVSDYIIISSLYDENTIISRIRKFEE